jgi:hypothetical protein
MAFFAEGFDLLQQPKQFLYGVGIRSGVCVFFLIYHYEL